MISESSLIFNLVFGMLALLILGTFILTVVEVIMDIKDNMDKKE